MPVSVIISPKSIALPVDAIVIKSIILKNVLAGRVIPPANKPRTPFEHPPDPYLA